MMAKACGRGTGAVGGEARAFAHLRLPFSALVALALQLFR